MDYFQKMKQEENMKTIKGIIFASSIKHNAKCIAGKYLGSDKWFRLVSDASGSAVSYEKAVFYNDLYKKSYPLVPLKVVSIPVDKAAPISGQPENIILGNGAIRQIEPFKINDIQCYCDNPSNLWGNGASVSAANITSITQSLYLIKPENVKLYKNRDEFNGKEKRYVSFDYNMIQYNLSCTDPKFDSLLENKNLSVQALCISLGENFNGYHYKIVAAIL